MTVLQNQTAQGEGMICQDISIQIDPRLLEGHIVLVTKMNEKEIVFVDHLHLLMDHLHHMVQDSHIPPIIHTRHHHEKECTPDHTDEIIHLGKLKPLTKFNFLNFPNQ
jgi:hypothetical protein